MAKGQANHRQFISFIKQGEATLRDRCILLRVLHIINGEYYAGAERVQDLLAMGLPDFGYSIDFACIKPARFPTLRRSYGNSLFQFAMKSRWDVRPARDIAELVRVKDYRALHTHTPRSALVGRIAAALSGIPWVHQVHSPTRRDGGTPWRDHVNAATERICVRRAVRVVAVSTGIRRYLENQRVASDRIRIVPNGVPIVSTNLAVKSLPAPPYTIGTMAMFRPRKGLEILLDALSRLMRDGYEFRLRIIGAFQNLHYEMAVKQLAHGLGLVPRIEWMGYTADTSKELSKLDLFVLPSLFGEGMPMVVLEAMSVGIPVIASRVDGIDDVLRHNRDGLLVQPGDAEELATALRGFWTGRWDWTALRENAYQRQRTTFSDREMARRTAAVYDEFLGSHGRACV